MMPVVSPLQIPYEQSWPSFVEHPLMSSLVLMSSYNGLDGWWTSEEKHRKLMDTGVLDRSTKIHESEPKWRKEGLHICDYPHFAQNAPGSIKTHPKMS